MVLWLELSNRPTMSTMMLGLLCSSFRIRCVLIYIAHTSHEKMAMKSTNTGRYLGVPDRLMAVDFHIRNLSQCWSNSRVVHLCDTQKLHNLISTSNIQIAVMPMATLGEILPTHELPSLFSIYMLDAVIVKVSIICNGRLHAFFTNLLIIQLRGWGECCQKIM